MKKKNNWLNTILEKIINVLPIKDKYKKILLQIVKFAIVGVLAFIIDSGIGLVCKNILHFSTIISSFLGFTISVIINYILSVKWVFDVNKEKKTKIQFLLFVIFSICGLIITEIIMVIGVDKLLFNYLLIKIFATIVVMIFNFITRKIFLEK